MSIRKIEFTVTENSISPATEQAAGLQGEHAATELKFVISENLFAKLQNECGDGDTLVYRFDTHDSIGNAVPYENARLINNSVSFYVGENLSRNGGRATVNLVVIRYNSKTETELELISRPARLIFENMPRKGKSNGNSMESLSTLAEIAKKAAEEALRAKEETELAKIGLEKGTLIFNGGGPESEIPIEWVIDNEVTDYSTNPVSSKAVSSKLKKFLLDIYPVGSIYLTLNDINPQNLFGGTWTQIKDSFLLAAGNTYSAGSTGGEAVHTLKENEIPSHNHGSKSLVGYMWNIASQSDTNNLAASGIVSTDMVEGHGYAMNSTSGVVDGFKIDATHTHNSFGGGKSHNNMPPYLAVYIWKRVA